MENVKQTSRNSRNDELYATNVKIYVESTTHSSNAGNLIEQSCPALLIRSQEAISKVVKHIYSHLAANSYHIDDGFPDIIISLISGRNVIDLQVILVKFFFQKKENITFIYYFIALLFKLS